MTFRYDEYLARQIELYTEPCEPKVIRVDKEYEGTNYDGSIEYSEDPIYNCEECDQIDCEHYKEFHNVEDIESEEENES